MGKVYAMIANGFEECECLCVVDLLRRAKIDTVLVSIESTKNIISSHNIKIEADEIISNIDFSDADLIFLPGGMPGSERLADCKLLIDALQNNIANGKRVAAICAAPSVVLGKNNLLHNKVATCYPGFEDGLINATYTSKGVVTDGLITTSRGLGFAFDLALELIKLLINEDVSESIKNAIQYC